MVDSTRPGGRLGGLLFFMPLLFVLGACTSAPGEIFKQFSFSDEKSITTGSRQRVVSSADVGSGSRPGLVNPKRVVCAEPSPDVAAIVANAFGFSVSVLGQGSGALSASQAEGVIQLAERTASIQLLRDQMYRACEAYANGAVSGTTYSLIMSKMNKVMVSLMLGETAGGAFGRRLAAAGGKASSKAKASASGFQDAVKDIDEAAAKLAAANKEAAEAEDAWKTKQALADKEPAGEQKDKLQGEAYQLKEKRDAAIAKRDALKDLLKNSISAAAETATEVMEITAGGQLNQRPDAAVAGVLKGMQKQYLDDDMSDAVISACLVDMSLASGDNVTINKKINAAAEKVVRQTLAVEDAKQGYGFYGSNVASAQADLKSAEDEFRIWRSFDRYSALSRFCDANLKEFMTNVRTDQHARKIKEIENERERIKAQDACADCQVSEYAKALKICSALGEDQKKQCIAGLANAAQTGKAPTTEKPENPKKPGQSGSGSEGDADLHPDAKYAPTEDEATAILAAFANLDKFPNPDKEFKVKDRKKKEPFEILQGYVEEIQLALGMEPKDVDGLIGTTTRNQIAGKRDNKGKDLDKDFVTWLLKKAIEKDPQEPTDETVYEEVLTTKDPDTVKKFRAALDSAEKDEVAGQPLREVPRRLEETGDKQPMADLTAEISIPPDETVAQINSARAGLGLPQNGHVTRLLVRLVLGKK